MLGFLQKLRDFISTPTHARTLSLLGIVALVAVVSLTVVVAQQQQNLKQKASAVCEDTSIPECPPEIATSGYDCSNQTFTCKVTAADKSHTVYGCQSPQGTGSGGSAD